MTTIQTLLDAQLETAKRVIGRGDNWVPEVMLLKGGRMAVSIVRGDDPMTGAILLIHLAQPDLYVFGSEAWIAFVTPEEMKHARRGDATNSEVRQETWVQVAASRGKECFSRLFTIDRINRTLDPIEKLGEQTDFTTRMPKSW